MPERKKLPGTALPRIFFIDREIASGAYPNANVLAKKYETSVATIKRDIELMRDQLNAPIEYSAQRRGYYYSKKTFRLPASYASADDVLALGMAKNLLTLYRHSPLYEAARNFLEGIATPLDSEGKSGWYEGRVVVPQMVSTPINEAVWNTVIAGLRENKIIAFEYQGAQDTEFRERRVRPYQLLFDASAWILYGHSEERKALRFFGLSRMKNVTLTENSFVMPKDYDYQALAEGSYFGIYQGQKTYQFSVDVYGVMIPWVKERTWTGDQQIRETKEGINISFSSHQFGKALQWILSMGRYARPLAPGELVEEWEKQVRDMFTMTEEQ